MKVINISAPYLRSLIVDICPIMTYRRVEFDPTAGLRVVTYHQEYERSDVVLDTPNLQHLEYADHLVSCYSTGNLNSLVKATIKILLNCGDEEIGFQSMLSLLTPLSNVQHLSLFGECTWILGDGEFKNKLPLFCNLNHLRAEFSGINQWHEVFLELLDRSPFLQRLTLTEGTGDFGYADMDEEYHRLAAELECQYWSTDQAIPSCFNFYLKRIVIGKYLGLEREFEMVKYVLKNALVLEELVIACTSNVDMIILESALKKLQRDSIDCSIKIRSFVSDF